ncbi:DUF4232 domain-containing protein [Streptomyces rhizosphaerihabitans]|uniref:DUF4232 domain-containing protein n=1 Tax=Streptomyces rhizosphaerihabitans TaxID=1266770 RepID=UPI0021C099CB|nr:DUF4232 domain-containing protein [Streptomyces rhizosphaerihabitans]MCT9006228.1 DUF4232 domain-containing protein [Streptomyces rhizosphaerihabitans]
MIATSPKRAGAAAAAELPRRSGAPAVAVPPRGGRTRPAVGLRAKWIRPVVLACLISTATGGCGLSAEIDRERDPGQTSAPDPVPSVVGTDASHAPHAAGTSTGDPLVIVVPGSSKAPPLQQDRGCPPSGLRLDTGLVDAAMGLRAVTLTLTDCGKRPYKVNGYPAIAQVLDEEGAPITGVHSVLGTDKVPMAPADPGPEPFTLNPGDSAHAALYWRMAAQHGVYLRVAPQKGQDAVTLRLPDYLDIGPENTLGTTAWTPAS